MFKRKDGRWAEWVTMPNGKRTCFYGKTKAELLRKISEHQNIVIKGKTLNEYIEDWLEFKAEFVTPKTLEGYHTPIRRLQEAFGENNPQDITAYQIQAFVNALAAQKYKRSTVQRPLDVLRMIFDYIITQPNSKVTSNPCGSVKVPRGLKQDTRDLASREDIEIIKNSLDHKFGLFAYFILYTGLRTSEALAVQDTCIKDGYIEIKHSLTWKGNNKPILSPTKTESGIRKVFILEPLRKVLPKFKGYLFSLDGGNTPMTKTQFRNNWDYYCRDVGLADAEQIVHQSAGMNKRTYTRTAWVNRVVPYQLRHEYATMCYDAGLDLKDTQKLMGHASAETTRRIYTHITDSRQQHNIEKLERFLSDV